MDSLFDGLTPEQVQQILHLGTLNQQNGMIDDQVQQALAGAKPSGVQHTSPMGALFGGLGDAAREVGGAAKAHQLRGQQQQNLTDQEKARQLFAQLLRGGGEQPTEDAGLMPAAGAGGLYG